MRSEGGAECRKIQKEIKPSGDDTEDGLAVTVSSTLKPDPDANWDANGNIVM